MNDYRFINIDQEPSEEQLAQLMHEVAVEAKERHDRAHAAYYAHLDQMLQALWVNLTLEIPAVGRVALC